MHRLHIVVNTLFYNGILENDNATASSTVEQLSSIANII